MSTPGAIAAQIFLALAAVLLGGCPEDGDGPVGPCDATYALMDHLAVTGLLHPSPVVPGSVVRVRGESFVVEDACLDWELVLRGGPSASEGEVVIPGEIHSINELSFTVTGETIEALGGGGSFDGLFEIRYRSLSGSRQWSAAAIFSAELATSIQPRISAVDQTEGYLNDRVLLRGSGFIGGGEGTTEVVVDGTFTPDEGGVPVDVRAVRLAAGPIEEHDRALAGFLWSPRIGGLGPGRFVGTVAPENLHGGTDRTSGAPVDLVFDQLESFVIGLAEEEVSLGQIVTLVGRGFIGQPDGNTTIRLAGQFHYPSGRIRDVTLDFVGIWKDGATLLYPIAITTEGGELHAVGFEAIRGVFRGHATPILTLDSDRREGVPVDVEMVLGPIRQVAWVRFLPGFSDSIELFGLGAVERELQERVVSRMQEIYYREGEPETCINVEFRTEEPVDFYDGGYAVIDIGGPDPNGYGLFGYDNTPGKDVNNLRLHDHVGGENALGAVDGFGYGGVFIESMLFWSEHPPFGDRPFGAPPADDRFDAIFDPVREREVVAGEWPTGADPERVAQIDLALHALSSMIADTAAHEFGHSLGLAQPYGAPDDYHNPVDLPGCLMDSGRHRPFEERIRLDGNEGSRFCGANLDYLLDILPCE